MAPRSKPAPRTDLSASISTSDRRRRRSAAIRERLFRASLELFAQKGFAETTVEDITEAADVGKGTFFNYFPSKDHILLAFGEMQLGKLEAAIELAGLTGEPMRPANSMAASSLPSCISPNASRMWSLLEI